jgi:hypothetical protein
MKEASVSLETTARSELLTMRKTADGVTVGALARTEALRRVLGGGDSRMAYNAIKHILLEHADDLAVTAASYSLGYASDGPTHLARLTDFGRDHGYDQRQARRYSDKGITALARYISSEWTLEASPMLRVVLMRADESGLELILQTERLHFIEMGAPRVDIYSAGGALEPYECDWTMDESDYPIVRYSTAISAPSSIIQTDPSIASVCWVGELWPLFAVSSSTSLGHISSIESLGARLMLTINEDDTPLSD